jgi:hypothetical protein
MDPLGSRMNIFTGNFIYNNHFQEEPSRRYFIAVFPLGASFSSN